MSTKLPTPRNRNSFLPLIQACCFLQSAKPVTLFSLFSFFLPLVNLSRNPNKTQKPLSYANHKQFLHDAARKYVLGQNQTYNSLIHLLESLLQKVPYTMKFLIHHILKFFQPIISIGQQKPRTSKKFTSTVQKL